MISWIRSPSWGGEGGRFGAEDRECGTHVLWRHGWEGDESEGAGEERTQGVTSFVRGDRVVGGA